MKTNYASIFLRITFIFICAGCNYAYSQSTGNLNIEKFRQEEIKSFINLSERKGGLIQNYRSTSASDNFDVNYYRCEWEVDPNIRFIKGKVTSYFSITSATDKIVFDLSDTLNVDSVIYRGNQMAYQKIGNDELQLQFPSILAAGNMDSVSIFYEGVPRVSSSYQAFTQATHNGSPIIWTLSEPYGAKQWWPCKNDLDDKADSIDVMITNPPAYQATSNGVMTQEYILNGAKLSSWRHRYPIASYLVALAVTNFTVLKDSVLIGGKSMDIIDYVFPEYTDYFNEQRIYTKQTLILNSNLFGDYPFAKEKYGLTQFLAGGGMEHQTNSFLDDPSEILTVHETSHQWFGDKVTCGSWQDIWLNEGFAIYCQVLFNEHIDIVNYLPILTAMTGIVTSQPGGSVWVNDTTDPHRIFSSRLTYYKGAYLLHMLRWKLGDDAFFRGINSYLNDPLLKYQYARTADLKRHLEQESGKDLTVFFQKWFFSEGFPGYHCTWMQNKNNWAYVQINQTTSHPSVTFYDMPVQLRFKNTSRDTLITVNNQQNGETFWINPGFMADSMFVDPYYHLLSINRIVEKIPSKSSMANDIKIFPNPASNILNIQLLNPVGPQINILMYNATGQLIYKTSKSLTGRDELLNIPVSQFAKGSYILKLSDNKNMILRKVIVK